MIWFIGDTHFGHANIIKYASRPFNDVAHMDAMLIKNWNDSVGVDDVVYHVGDVAFLNSRKAIEVVKRLNGQIHLIVGNHDKKQLRDENYHDVFASVNDLLEIKVDDDQIVGEKAQMIVLCHYSMKVWNQSHRGSWQLFGHSHGTLPDDPGSLSIDVGVDATRLYRPISYKEVKAIISKKTFKPIDRHGT